MDEEEHESLPVTGSTARRYDLLDDDIRPHQPAQGSGPLSLMVQLQRQAAQTTSTSNQMANASLQ